MKIDFEVVDPELGENLHLAVDFLEEFGLNIQTTWGQEAFSIAQAEIAEFDVFPEYDDQTEGVFIKTVVGRINDQVYACVAVFCDGGVDIGHPLLIDYL